ncbi:MAG: hypothetical protein M5R36_04655 [Deltaproteobacteria bacterium]|nr:hypothetical protein [Deltaproteobacteria bacterium]
MNDIYGILDFLSGPIDYVLLAEIVTLALFWGVYRQQNRDHNSIKSKMESMFSESAIRSELKSLVRRGYEIKRAIANGEWVDGGGGLEHYKMVSEHWKNDTRSFISPRESILKTTAGAFLACTDKFIGPDGKANLDVPQFVVRHAYGIDYATAEQLVIHRERLWHLEIVLKAWENDVDQGVIRNYRLDILRSQIMEHVNNGSKIKLEKDKNGDSNESEYLDLSLRWKWELFVLLKSFKDISPFSYNDVGYVPDHNLPLDVQAVLHLISSEEIKHYRAVHQLDYLRRRHFKDA